MIKCDQVNYFIPLLTTMPRRGSIDCSLSVHKLGFVGRRDETLCSLSSETAVVFDQFKAFSFEGT